MSRNRLLLFALLAGAVGAPLVGMAQEATPEPRAILEPCTAEPRVTDDLLTIWFDEAGAPRATPTAVASFPDIASVPEGERADDATVAAITETTLHWISCLEFSNQPIRGFSLMTDELVSQFGPNLGDPAQDTPEDVRGALETQLAATPVAAAATTELATPLDGPRRPRLLDDGRAGAIWSLRGDRLVLIYEQVDGVWLVDEIIDIIEPVGTPVATPGP